MNQLKIKSRLVQLLPANDFGEAVDYFGIKSIHKGDNSITILQHEYFENETEFFVVSVWRVPCDLGEDLSTRGTEAADKEFPIRHLIGGLLYYATHTHPDITEAAGMPARYVEKSSVKHAMGVLKLIKYWSGTSDYGLTLRQGIRKQL